jgi:hypothetical protein
METASNDDQGSPDLVFGDVGGWISGPSLDAGPPLDAGLSPDAGRPGGPSLDVSARAGRRWMPGCRGVPGGRAGRAGRGSG